MGLFDFDSKEVIRKVEENRKAAGLTVENELKEQESVDEVQKEVQKDEGFFDSWKRESRFSVASEQNLPYVVLQVTLKEKVFGTGSGNLTDLEEVINAQVSKGYRLHTMSTSNGGSKGIGGGDRIQATLVFERLDVYKAALGIQ